MRPGDRETGIQVLTDHRGWPVAVSEGPVWWMVADIEATEHPECKSSGEEKFYWLQLTNGQQLIACHDMRERQWSVAWRNGTSSAHRAM